MVGDDCNGNGKVKLELGRRDWMKVAGFVFGLTGLILGAVVPLSMYVFQTREDALTEHAAIELKSALHAKEVEVQKRYEDRAAQDTKRIMRTFDINQRKLMAKRGILKRETEPLPAGIDFDELPGGAE